MVLLRQNQDKNINIFECVFSSEPLNARIMDWIPYDNRDETYKEVCKAYDKWKTNK